MGCGSSSPVANSKTAINGTGNEIHKISKAPREVAGGKNDSGQNKSTGQPLVGKKSGNENGLIAVKHASVVNKGDENNGPMTTKQAIIGIDAGYVNESIVTKQPNVKMEADEENESTAAKQASVGMETGEENETKTANVETGAHNENESTETKHVDDGFGSCDETGSIAEISTRANCENVNDKENQSLTEQRLNKHTTNKSSRYIDVYAEMDTHARKAPENLKHSADDVIRYLSSVSTDPKVMIRGIFVWISENIRYDVDGYFGRTQKGPYDSAGVMKSGKAVCEGYANVVVDLCRKANITVKKISGFAKGFSHTTGQEITEASETNHAWNAVKIDGKWFLLDSTWGAGHLNRDHEFEKKFDEFYFLANPKHIISSHFPYMDGNVEESKKWQLLDKPVSLKEFSRRVEYTPAAFEIGAKAVSHPYGYIEMKNELKMQFKGEGPDDIICSARLMLHDGNVLSEQPNATFGYLENKVFTLLVHPPKVGKYTLDVFGYLASDCENSKSHLMGYTINCSEVKDPDFLYPLSYHHFDVEHVAVVEPMRGKLRANTEVMFKITAPHLEVVKAGNTYLEKDGKTFTGLVKTGAPGSLSVFGNREGRYHLLHGLLEYEVPEEYRCTRILTQTTLHDKLKHKK